MGELITLPKGQYHSETGLGPGKYITRSMIVEYDASKSGFEDKYVLNLPHTQFNGNDGTDWGKCYERALRCKMLDEPMPFITDQHITPSGNLSKSQEALAWRDEMRANDCLIISDLELAKLNRLIEKTLANPFCRWLLEKVEHWSPVYRWQDEDTGLWLQVEWDAIAPGVAMIDIKSTRKALRKWPDITRELGYDFQNAFYQDAYEHYSGSKLHMAFILGQNIHPLEVSPEQIPEHVIEACRVKYRKALRGIMAEDYGNDDRQAKIREWPAYIDFQLQAETGQA